MNSEMWLIWKEPKSRKRSKIGILTNSGKGYIFEYVNPELNDAQKNGFSYFPGFDDITKKYISDKLFANIQTRLPNPNRPDYLEILNSYNLNNNSSEFEILKATKGRLLTDNYEFLPAFDKNKIEFEIAGTRHYLGIEKSKKILSINDKLSLELEPTNKYDENAIKVMCLKNDKKYHLGYVPRCYSKELTDLLNKEIRYSTMIKSLNFEAAINDENVTASVKLIFDN